MGGLEIEGNLVIGGDWGGGERTFWEQKHLEKNQLKLLIYTGAIG